MNIDEAEIKVRRSSLDAQAPVTDSHGRSAPSRRSASIPVRRADLCPVVPFFFPTGWILRRSEDIVVMIQHGSERDNRRHLFVVPDRETMLRSSAWLCW